MISSKLPVVAQVPVIPAPAPVAPSPMSLPLAPIPVPVVSITVPEVHAQVQEEIFVLIEPPQQLVQQEVLPVLIERIDKLSFRQNQINEQRNRSAYDLYNDRPIGSKKSQND